MQLVIEIDDEVYSHVKDVENRLLTPNEENVLRESVVNGTPLPKGHGQLFDATFALDAKITSDNNGVSERTKGWNEACQAIFENAPTIIEADGSDENEVD